MRIIAGTHRGRALTPVGQGDANAHLRPTTDRIRETIFNILIGGRVGVDLDGAVIADVFCGTGAMGLEALSRGASLAQFVDNGRVALGLVQQNITLLKEGDRSAVIKADARQMPPLKTPADVVFLDPPYSTGLGEVALERMTTTQSLRDGAVIVFEDNAPAPALPSVQILDQRSYGGTVVSFLQKRPQ